MSIKYYKLFDLLNRRGMKKSDLRTILSSATVAKLSKHEYISGDAIAKICAYLECQPGDIMEYVADEPPKTSFAETMESIWRTSQNTDISTEEALEQIKKQTKDFYNQNKKA